MNTEWRDGDDWPNWLESALNDAGVRQWLRGCHELFSDTVMTVRAHILLKLLDLSPAEAADVTGKDLLERLKAIAGAEARFSAATPVILRLAARHVKASSRMQLRQELLEKFPRPAPLTKAEVWDSIESAFLYHTKALDESIRDLGDSLCVKCRQGRSSGQLLVARMTGERPSAPAPMIFKSENVQVTWDRVETREVVSLEPALPKAEGQVALFGRVSGDSSAQALRRAAGEIAAVIRTALIAASDMEHPRDADAHPRIPTLTAGGFANHADFVSTVLSEYYAADVKKDSMPRRVRNCVLLMVEAHRQNSEAIAMALYCSAMEALLGRKGSEITNTLAENIAALLEPDLRHRADAVEFVKELYNTRSRILHGERLSADDQSLRNARCLVCAILAAVRDRVEFFAKTGLAPEKPDDFLVELNRHKFNSGQLVGVGMGKAVELWRQASSGPTLLS